MSNIINSYRFVTAASGYLLDTYSNGVGAYSFRKLKNTATNAIKIRRDSDDATTDVLLESSGSITTSSTVSAGGNLATWIGSNNGFIDTWYDQSGSGYDLSEATLSDQFNIVVSGTMETKNGKAAATKTTSDQKGVALGSGMTELADGNSLAIFLVSAADTLNRIGTCITCTSASGTGNMTMFRDGRTQIRQVSIKNNTIYINLSARRNVTDQVLTNLHSDGSSYYGYDNEVAGTTITPSSGRLNSDFVIGGVGWFNSGNTHSGSIQEVIVFSNEMVSDRTSIQTDIDSFYSIP